MIPDGYRNLTPYRIVARDTGAATVYEKALRAKPRLKLARRDAKLGHTELGEGVTMPAEEYSGHEAYAPTRFGGSPVALHLYAEDVGADCSVAAGAPLKRRVPDMFYCGRAGSFVDPFGYVWHVATPIEEVPPCEINRRAAAAMGQGADP